MKQYETTKVIWRKGIEVAVGSKVWMSNAESKYLKHALKDVIAEASEPAPEPAPDVEPVVIDPDLTPTLGAVVEEGRVAPAPQERSRRHRMRHVNA